MKLFTLRYRALNGLRLDHVICRRGSLEFWRYLYAFATQQSTLKSNQKVHRFILTTMHFLIRQLHKNLNADQYVEHFIES